MDALGAALKSLQSTVSHLHENTATDREVTFGIAISQTWAEIAKAEQLRRIADALEPKTTPPDPREPGETWSEYYYRQQA